MKLTNQDLDILRELLEKQIKELNNQDDNIAIYINIIKKLDTMYFA
jgi:hypothetical protein